MSDATTLQAKVLGVGGGEPTNYLDLNKHVQRVFTLPSCSFDNFLAEAVDK